MKRVVHIEDRAGPRGGEYWVLDLECGHMAVRPKPPFRIWKLFQPPEEFMAPQEVKCSMCDS